MLRQLQPSSLVLVVLFSATCAQYVHVKEDFVGLVPPELFDFFSNLTLDQVRILRTAADKHNGNDRKMEAEIERQDPELAARSKEVFGTFSAKMNGLNESARRFIGFIMQALRSAEYVKQAQTLRTIAGHVSLQWNRLEAGTKDQLAKTFPTIAKTLTSRTFLDFAKPVKKMIV